MTQTITIDNLGRRCHPALLDEVACSAHIAQNGTDRCVPSWGGMAYVPLSDQDWFSAEAVSFSGMMTRRRKPARHVSGEVLVVAFNPLEGVVARLTLQGIGEPVTVVT